jgi:SSS family transporter
MEVKTIELLIVAAYLIACIMIGAYISRRALSTEEMYWVGGKFLGKIGGGFATFAMIGSASTVMGAIGLGYSVGLPIVALIAMCFSLQFPFWAYLVLNPMVRGNYLTLGDFFVRRGGKKPLLFVYSIITFIVMTFYNLPQFKASGILGSWLLGIPFWQGVLISGIVVVIYASIGGQWAVVMTDILQGIIMFIFPLLLAIIALVSFGGPGQLVELALSARPQIATSTWSIWSMLGLALTWSFWSMGNPMSMMRAFAFKDVKSARRAMLIASLCAGIIIFVAFVDSLAASAISPKLPVADMAVVVVADKFLPPILKGLFIAGLFAAIMSTVDSLLITAASALIHDIYKGLINPNVKDTTITHLGAITVLALGVLMILLTLLPELPLISVLTAIGAGLLISACAAPVVMALHWKRTNNWGMLGGMLCGSVSYVLAYFTPGLPFLSAMLISLPISFIATAIISYATQPS